MRLLNDNLAALLIERTETNSTRTNHYTLKFHVICEAINKDMVVTQHVESDLCLADFFTKILPPARFITPRAYMVAVDVNELSVFTIPKTDKSNLSKYI